jgi:hypothetical protein
MAALTPTHIGRPKPLGDRMVRTIRFTIANANAADEWIVTGLSWVDAVLGIIVTGTGVENDVPTYLRNCQGTGQTEDTQADGGKLAIEGAAGTWEVTVIGKR